jgi:hypothetical protein
VTDESDAGVNSEPKRLMAPPAVPGHYERPDETLECTALGYALRFKDEPHGPDEVGTVTLLQAEGAPL